jgi:hypothetical protein
MWAGRTSIQDRCCQRPAGGERLFAPMETPVHGVAFSQGKIGLTMSCPSSPSRRRGRHGRRSSETTTLARIRDFLPVGWCESAITVAGTARRKVVTLSLRRRCKAHGMDTSARYARARPWNSAWEEMRAARSVLFARITVSCPCVGRSAPGREKPRTQPGDGLSPQISISSVTTRFSSCWSS